MKNKICYVGILLLVVLFTLSCNSYKDSYLDWEQLPSPIYEISYGDGTICDNIYVTDDCYKEIYKDGVLTIESSDYYTWTSFYGAYNPIDKTWNDTKFLHHTDSITIYEVIKKRQLK